MMNHYFDCTGYSESDRFITTVERMAIKTISRATLEFESATKFLLGTDPRKYKWETDDKGQNNNNHYEETTLGKKKIATTNVQTGTVDETEETTQNLIHGVDEYNAEDDDDFDYEEHLFLQLETHDVLHLKDGINGGRIPKSWILLDSQSTTDVYSNPHLLTNIRKAKGTLTIHTQAGKAITTMKGTVKGYGDVWYHAKGIANILSLANVAKTRKVVFNSSNGNQFEVMKNDGTSQIFKKSEHGLYFYDMKKKDQIPK